MLQTRSKICDHFTAPWKGPQHQMLDEPPQSFQRLLRQSQPWGAVFRALCCRNDLRDTGV